MLALAAAFMYPYHGSINDRSDEKRDFGSTLNVSMDLAQKTHADREPVRMPQLFTRIGQCCHVVANFFGIRQAFQLPSDLEHDDIFERRLSALNLLRNQRLLSDEAVKKPFVAGNHRRCHLLGL